jgi:tetratricopeptide (TPR) repeat protein
MTSDEELQALLDRLNSLTAEKRYAEAEAILEALLRENQYNLVLLVRYARLAALRGDLAQELLRSMTIVQRFGDHPAGPTSLGIALRKIGRFDDAEACLSAAMRRFVVYLPSVANDPWLRQIAVQHAHVALDRHELALASRRFSALQPILPNDASVKHGIGLTALKLRMEAAFSHSDEDASVLPSSVSITPYPGSAELVTAFESLGRNCEFGLVQRHFGAEPLGLLRWSATEPAGLCAMLAERFDGLDDAANLHLTINFMNEYYLSNKKFGMGMHTFINAGKDSETKVFAMLLRRLAFLKRKLLEDLEGSSKIFVYKSDTPVPFAMQMRLVAAVEAYNPNNKLVVVQVGQNGAPASCAQIAPGLLLGLQTRPSKNGVQWDIPFEDWENICTAAKHICAGEANTPPVFQPSGAAAAC